MSASIQQQSYQVQICVGSMLISEKIDGQNKGKQLLILLGMPLEERSIIVSICISPMKYWWANFFNQLISFIFFLPILSALNIVEKSYYISY